MEQSRRDFVQLTTGALGAGSLLSGAAAAGAAAEKPTMDWQPAHYSNYEDANRSNDDVRWIVVHTIEGSASAGINWFQNPDANVSSHFVIDADGSITKMVNVEDVAWTQGNGPYNDTGISIELAGYAGETQFSAAVYESVGKLCAYLCETYGIPKRHPTVDIAPCSAYDGEGGLIGHEQVPSPYDCDQVTGGKTDPGSTWNWGRLVDEIDGGSGGAAEFEPGDAVETTAAVNVRSSPRIGQNVTFTQPDGVTGTVKRGPRSADGFTFWKVAYENGQTGWSAGKYLAATTTDAAFRIGQEVASTTRLNVRSGPSTDDDPVGVVADGTVGWVKDGFVTADGYTWWKVEYADGTLGWSVQTYLEAHSGGANDDTTGGVVPDGFDVNTELTREVAVTGDQIDAAIAAERPNSPLIGLGDTFVAVQEREGVDALYQAAHAIHESAWGTSTIAQDKKNLFGWGAVDSDPYDGAKAFDSFEACVRYVMGEVKELYLTPGNWRYNGPTLSGMNVYYATDGQWAEKIAGHYRTLVENVDFSATRFSAGDAVETSDAVNVRSAPAIADNVTWTQPTGVTGEVEAGPRRADGFTFWKVAYENGKTGWSVGKYLVEAAGDAAFQIGQKVASTTRLNVRSGPGTDEDPVGVVPDGTEGWVKDGYVTADGYTWWKVKYADGTTGWSVETYLTGSPGGDTSDRYLWPVSGEVTSTYYDDRPRGTHGAIDVAAPTGRTVTAAKAGVVSVVTRFDGGGKAVFVDHGDGSRTEYHHLSEWSVSEGERVLQGEEVGVVGSTGISTGPHLHFEVVEGGENQVVDTYDGAQIQRGEPFDLA